LLDTALPLTMVLSETTGSSTIHYLHGLGLVAESDGTSTDYFLQDGLGSVRQLTDDSASARLTQTFDPYGNQYATAGTAQSAFGYTGEMQDSLCSAVDAHERGKRGKLEEKQRGDNVAGQSFLPIIETSARVQASRESAAVADHEYTADRGNDR
jgi:hypothetical protein